tara:strand:- start:20023 stop:21474 length:1452 start_codon:yes stop_codon:yes gene_type:complete
MNLLYPFAKRFIAGHDFDSAKPNIQTLINKGFEVSVDYLGELSETPEDCFRAKDQYLEIISFYKNNKIDISIKPSQLGLLIDKSMCLCLLKSVVQSALVHGHTVRLDMENSEVTSDTIGLCLKMKERYPNIGIALQANLHRTKQDIKELLNKDISIRLVKGAYKESAELAYQSDKKIKNSFLLLAELLKSHNPNKYHAIGTHDEELLSEIEEGLYEYEFLYGIRRDIQNSLKDKGERVRIYVPFGTDWFPYCSRRLNEFKNLKFVMLNVIKEWFNRNESSSPTVDRLSVINNFLSKEDFEQVLNVVTSRSRNTNVVLDGGGVFADDDENVNKTIALLDKAVKLQNPDIKNYKLKDAIYRYENKTGVLHHDLNRRDKRRYSLILYVEEPTEGGEIVFPFYDSNGNRTNNIVTEECEKLNDRKTYYSTTESSIDYINKNKNNLYSLSAMPNTAVILDNDNENLWHYACPVEEGNRSCIVLFWERE